MYGSDKVSLSANFYSPGVILVIFDPSRPMPPIRPFWLKTKYTSDRKFVVVSDRAAPSSSTTRLGPVPIAQTAGEGGPIYDPRRPSRHDLTLTGFANGRRSGTYGRLDREISAFLLGKPASVTSLVPLRTRIEAQRRAFLRAFEKAIGRYGQRGGAGRIRTPGAARASIGGIQPQCRALFGQQNAPVPERICSPGIRLCSGFLRFASSPG